MPSHDFSHMNGDRGLRGLALFGALTATFDAVHPTCDQWLQGSRDAAHKGSYGDHMVYLDGTPIDETTARDGEPTVTATRLGQLAAAGTSPPTQPARSPPPPRSRGRWATGSPLTPWPPERPSTRSPTG